jgi:ureidoacrylate peracid hydrolase
MKQALLIVDMENDVIKEGGYNHSLVKDGIIPIDFEFYASPIPNVKRLAEAFRAAGKPVIYITLELRPDYSDACFPYWRMHEPIERHFHVEGTWGAQIVDELTPEEGDYKVIKKGFGGFHNTELETILHNLDIDTCVVTGVGTPVCVGSTVREGVSRNFRMVVVSDGTASFTRPSHEGELKTIMHPIADVKTTDEVIETLE